MYYVLLMVIFNRCAFALQRILKHSRFGRISLKCYYDAPEQRLTVEILHAADLIALDANGKKRNYIIYLYIFLSLLVIYFVCSFPLRLPLPLDLSWFVQGNKLIFKNTSNVRTLLM